MDRTERLHGNADALWNIFEQCSDGILVTDSDNTIVYANGAACRITGYEREELDGQDPKLLTSGKHDAAFYARLWNGLKSAGTWHGEVWDRRKDGRLFPLWLSISSIRDNRGLVVNHFAIFNEISAQSFFDENVQRLRNYDPLTDLPNRFLFQDRLHHALLRAGRNHHAAVVMLMDLDNFKMINEGMGHQIGDVVLQQAAQRLAACVRKGETFARMGGDEFAVILADIADATTAIKAATIAAQRMQAALAEPISANSSKFFITMSIGITVYPDDAKDSSDLVKDAEAAMYHAKKHGSGSYQFYAAHMNARAKERMTFANKLHAALDNNEFSLDYQPQLGTGNGVVTGLEALLRWNSPELGRVSPAQFIPLLEESRLILPVGRWVLTEALRFYKRLSDQGLGPGRIAVNISARQFEEPDLTKVVSDAIAAAGVDPRVLELEITESMIMTNTDKAVATLHALRSIGVTIAVDDFGTGYSSVSYLKRFPLNRLKVDKSFVQDVTRNADDAAITAAIVAIAHNLNLSVIAEGVETSEQLDFLGRHQCEEVQGYLFSRPLPPEDCITYLRRAGRGT